MDMSEDSLLPKSQSTEGNDRAHDWSELCADMMESVFSSLSISDLRNVQLVCKRWNLISTRPSFHNLWNDIKSNNNKRENSIFMWRTDWERTSSNLTPVSSGGFAFFDLDAEQWHSTFSNTVPEMDCFMFEFRSPIWSLLHWDPIAMTEATLPALPCKIRDPRWNSVHVSQVDNACRCRVFVFQKTDPSATDLPRGYVHELGSNEWQEVENTPSNIADAVCSQNKVFVANLVRQDGDYDQLQIFRNNGCRRLEEVWCMHFGRKIACARLTASSGRLFAILTTTVNEDLGFPCPDRDSMFPGFDTDATQWMEIYEVVLAEEERGGSRRKRVAKLAMREVYALFDWKGSASVFPQVGPDGNCRSVVFTREGIMWRYDVATATMKKLPAHPWASTGPPSANRRPRFQAVATKLRLSHVLSVRE